MHIYKREITPYTKPGVHFISTVNFTFFMLFIIEIGFLSMLDVHCINQPLNQLKTLRGVVTWVTQNCKELQYSCDYFSKKMSTPLQLFKTPLQFRATLFGIFSWFIWFCYREYKGQANFWMGFVEQIQGHCKFVKLSSEFKFEKGILITLHYVLIALT